MTGRGDYAPSAAEELARRIASEPVSPEYRTFNNPYGYRYNINHPTINRLFFRFKKWKGIGETMPLSDRERFEFEAWMDKLFREGGVSE